MATELVAGSNGTATGAANATTLYARLSDPFGETHRDTRGGVTFDYITGEQAVTRLNEVLGAGGWSFGVLEHGIHEQADEVWVLGQLRATLGGEPVVRQQFGSQKVKRSRQSGTPLDIGFDLKGAATDALKKCATLLGVGLYLSHKEGLQRRVRDQPEHDQPERDRAPLVTAPPTPAVANPAGVAQGQGAGGVQSFSERRDATPPAQPALDLTALAEWLHTLPPPSTYNRAQRENLERLQGLLKTEAARLGVELAPWAARVTTDAAWALDAVVRLAARSDDQSSR